MIELKVEFPKEFFESDEGNTLLALMTERLEEHVVQALDEATNEFRCNRRWVQYGDLEDKAKQVERLIEIGTRMASWAEDCEVGFVKYRYLEGQG
jgi:hypothetical protein